MRTWLRMVDITFWLTADTPDRLAAFEKTEAVNTPDIADPPANRGSCK